MPLLILREGKIIDSASIVPQEKIENVTGSRELNAVYQNTTGKNLTVQVTLHCTTSAADDEALGRGLIGDSQYILFGVSTVGIPWPAVGAARLRAVLPLIVAPNKYYQIWKSITGTGFVSVDQWYEMY